MTTYEVGVRVISMLRWPDVIKSGQIPNDIQGHQDMFTSLAAAAGVDNVAEKVMAEKNSTSTATTTSLTGKVIPTTPHGPTFFTTTSPNSPPFA